MEDSAPPNQGPAPASSSQDVDVSITDESKGASDGTVYSLPCMGTKNHNASV